MMSLVKGLIELVRGMTITGKHLGKHAVTLQYPEEKDNLPERSRGFVVLLSDKETGELNCTGCELCMRACPTAAIKIEAPRDPETKKRVVKIFVVDNTLCCFCGLCEEACNFSALKMAGQYYELSTENKDDLVWDKNKLQEMGRPVPYEDTRKKKPVKKPAVDANPQAPVPPAEPKQPAAAEANPGESKEAAKPPEEPKSNKPEGEDN